jgi:hypothetical protein
MWSRGTPCGFFGRHAVRKVADNAVDNSPTSTRFATVRPPDRTRSGGASERFVQEPVNLLLSGTAVGARYVRHARMGTVVARETCTDQ